MKYIFPVSLAIFASFLQLTFPSMVLPAYLTIDFIFIAVVLIATFVKPITAVLWIALVAGALMDLWLPSHFGLWIIASLLVASITLFLNHKVLPRMTNIGLILTAGLGLLGGLLVLFFGNLAGSNLSLGSHIFSLLSNYLLRLPLDLIMFALSLWLARKLIKTFNPAANV